MWKEFKRFIANDSIVTLATGFIMGGAFIQAVINFILIASMLFAVLKGLEKAQNKKIISPDTEPEAPSNEEVLLGEILSELKKK